MEGVPQKTQGVKMKHDFLERYLVGLFIGLKGEYGSDVWLQQEINMQLRYLVPR